MSEKKKVEAVLFSLGKEVSLERLAGLCSLEKEKVKEIVEELKKDYEQRDHSLRVINRGENWKLTVKDDFLPLVNKLVEGMDLDKALVETLAVIAWKYPVVQSEVIKLRHNKAYEHIKRLMELEFVEKEKDGRTYKLKLTKKFFEYFDLPSEEAKGAFLREVPPKVLKTAEEVDKEADEAGYLREQEKKEKKAREEIKEAMGEVRKEEKEGLEKRRGKGKGKEKEREEEAEGGGRKITEGKERVRDKKVAGGGDDDDDDGDDDGDEEEKIAEGLRRLFG